ncbi:E3 ubiquitin-protein ligase RBBP6-like isoform X1 [Macrosteles quadrilineatus]|uniref:E3 ubiquitin-protein ligase RBBP6-like isoform X1 n=1 Tax=Macrosteles quadrilineatus TaxID=74068 RepID=UPI0023E24712|nr:E3 ubiquitin-protein ligase RBBP6-like isoform X1 [Macrosteles quadrilineatus]
MSVHYKFKSALKYDTITFDGLHISVKDLKRDILQQKQIGKTGDFDLQITNAQTNEVYQDENTLIPKNSALIVVRVPLTAQQKRAWDRQEANQQLAGLKHVNPNIPLTYQEGQDPLVQKLAKAVDLSSLDASEDDKIAAMMTQSTQDYDPVNYARIRGTTQVGEVPPNYRCYKCHQAGHWIKDCRLGQNQENQPEIRKSTGIPRSFMVPVEGPQVPGAMMTPTGQFAVPSIDRQAYIEGKKPSMPLEEVEAKPHIPEELVCPICHDLLTDTVMIPCCGCSFCDECIRTVLLESENHKCPDCGEIGISPDTMIPNRYLRKSVDTWLNKTGYQRSQPVRALEPPQGQSIQALGNNRPPEVINLVETPDVDSPRTNRPMHNNSSKERDRIPQYSQPDRSATPTVDERTTLPDTSVPPPVNTYPITSTAYPPANYGPPPGYGGPPPNYPRVPLPYPNLGPGPTPSYPPVEPRGNMRPGYGRPYIRRGGSRIHGGYHDRNNLPPGAIDDPLSAFEKILREKDKERERIRRRKRSFSRSLSPRPRSRASRSRSPPLHHRKRGTVSPTPPPVRQRSRTRTRSPSPPPRRHSPSPVSHPRGARSRSLHRSRSKSRTPPRREVRSRSRTPVKRRSPSFTISKFVHRSRSRSFSRTPSPRDRHFSPRRRDERFRSPLQGRNSPQRFHSRRRPPDDYEPTFYENRRGGRTRGYPRDPTYFTSPVRYETRYDDRGRGYQQGSSRPETSRYSSRSSRYDNYNETVPPGTETSGNYDQYPAEYSERRVTVVSDKRDRDREREREAAARDWERTRDRELETREKERMREYEEYHRGYRNTKSSSPRKRRSHERGKENKRGEGEAIEAINLRDQNMEQFKNSEPPHATTLSTRVPVLVDLKKEPSDEREKRKEKEKEEFATPIKEKDKEKKKEKDKKKKKEGEKKEKKKKRKEKKDIVEKTKLEPVKTIEGKPIVVAAKVDTNPIDPLYGDIEGTSVDKEVVQNYGKVEQKGNEGDGNVESTKQASEVKENVVLAPVPELSKWELDEDLLSQDDKMSREDGYNSTEKKVVTSEVLKRAENAIFQKAINAIRPIDIKKGTSSEKIPEKVKERKDSKDAPPKDQPAQEIVNVSPETTTNDSREARKVANSIQITIPSHQSKAPERSVEIASTAISIDSSDPLKSRSHSEKPKVASVPVIPNSPVRKSAKERLGAKIENDREEIRRVRSTVERKSRSRTPKRYLDRKFSDREKLREISPGARRVVVNTSWSRERERDETRRKAIEINKSVERKVEKISDKDKERRREKRSRSSSREKKLKKEMKTEKIIIRKREEKPVERLVTVKVDQTKDLSEKKGRKNPRLSSDRRKSALDEANFEPDYDASEPESEPEVPGEEKSLLVTLSHSSPPKKRSRSPSNEKEKKKLKSESEIERTTDLMSKVKDLEKVKKIEPETDESSDSNSSSDSSSDSSIERKKRKKKKSKKRKKKKSRKRKESSSESESSESSSSDSDSGKKKKKHKHKKKSSKSKKRKKSKHK